MDQFGPQGLALLVVISGQPSGAPASLEYCAKVRTKYDLGEHAVCDPDDVLLAYGKNALVLLLDADLTLSFKKVVASHDALIKTLQDRLSE
jgi:hypothetical protein